MKSAVAVLLLLGCAAAAGAFEYEAFDSTPELHSSSGWGIGNSPAMGTPVKVTIVLAKQNLAMLEYLAHDLANPDSPNYAKYPELDELNAMTSPSAESAGLVTKWLLAEGVPTANMSLGSPADHIVLNIDSQLASYLFRADLRTATNVITGQRGLLTVGSIYLPRSLHAHVDAVFGLTGLPLPPRVNKRSALNYPDVTPDVITKVYGISGVEARGSDTNIQAVAEFQGQLFSQEDLDTFFRMYVPKYQAFSKVYKTVGDKQQGEGVEANLDIQFIMGVAPKVKTEVWQYAGMDFCTDLITWTNQILSTKDGRPSVFSVSYGWQGPLSQLGCTDAQVKAVDANFAKAGSVGTTIIFASGDSGAQYMNNQLWPSWPASSQHVTAVGATGFEGATASGPESAVTQFGSGGGFSWTIARAGFQDATITKYLMDAAGSLPPKNMFNSSGRATPDVAALGEGFQVIMNGSPTSVGGTSAATPTFSAVVSLLNEAREQKGMGKLGNLNQFIYKHPEAFTDIVKGTDKISRYGGTFPYGFDCRKGWDPVTGFGTPAFAKLLAAVTE